MATHDLVYATAQEVDDAIRAVKASGANAAAWLTNLAFLNVTAGTAELSKAVVLDASKQIDELDVTGNLKSHTKFVMEGYATGRNVIRAVRLRLQPGATPGTNINVTLLAVAVYGFNAPTISDATNLAASGSSGSFTLSADGTELTLDITEVIIGALSSSIPIHDLNSSSTTEMYTVGIAISGANLRIRLFKRGASSAVSFLTVLNAGDLCDIYIGFVTSS